MSNQQDNNTQVDDDVQRLQPPLKHYSRNFYRKRPGNERENQDLAEDENRPVNDADDGQRSNNSDENNNNDDNTGNNTRGRGRRGGFRRGRGRGRFIPAVPFFSYRRGYSPYTNYVNGSEGFFGPPSGFYGQPYRVGVSDLPEQEGFNGYPVRNNRGFRGGRGRAGRQRRATNNENADNTNNNNNDNNQQQGEDNNTTTTNNNNDNNNNSNTTTTTNNNTNKRRQRKQRRRINDNGSGTEQQTDGAVTDDQQKDENNKGSAHQRRKKSNRRLRRNTNASQSGPETEERVKSGRTRKPRDDETIVKYLLRSMVNKVARRVAPRVRTRSRANTKDANENNTNVEQSQTHNHRRGGRNQRAVRGRSGNGYFIEQGYYDPYGMSPYYYGAYYGFGGRSFGGARGRGRGRGGRGRGRARQQGDANKENQPQDNNDQGKLEDSNSTGDNSQTKPAISEQVNQLS